MKETYQSEVPQNMKFRLDNVLVKNLSLEMPDNVVTPSFAKEPTIQLELRNRSRPLNQENYAEIILEATVRLRSGDDLQLLIEVSQAGIFLIDQPDHDKRQEILNVQAPETLYPYLNHLVSDLLSRAGAIRVFLPPFDFKAVYEKKRLILEQKLADEAQDKKISS